MATKLVSKMIIHNVFLCTCTLVIAGRTFKYLRCCLLINAQNIYIMDWGTNISISIVRVCVSSKVLPVIDWLEHDSNFKEHKTEYILSSIVSSCASFTGECRNIS